jgi:hypothetical protein
MAHNPLRPQVLSLYRKILRAGKTWTGPIEERSYILTEARSLFRRNKGVKDVGTIQEKLFEGQSRLELGLHYKIPWPRLYNAPPRTTSETLKEKFEQAKPAYMHSYLDEEAYSSSSQQKSH